MIVDTSAWIDFFNDQPSWQAIKLRKAIEEGERIVLPGIVFTEILLGFASEKDVDRVSTLLGAFEISTDISLDDYHLAAKIYRTCRRRGKTIRSTIDSLIAAICLRDDLALLSKDRDFQSIARCFPLNCISE